MVKVSAVEQLDIFDVFESMEEEENLNKAFNEAFGGEEEEDQQNKVIVFPKLPFSKPQWKPKQASPISSETKAKVVEIAEQLETKVKQDANDNALNSGIVELSPKEKGYAKKYKEACKTFGTLSNDSYYEQKKDESFRTMYDNRDAELFRYVLIMANKEGKITKSEYDKLFNFYRLICEHVNRDRKNIKCYSAFFTFDQLEKFNYRRNEIRKLANLLVYFGYIFIIRVNNKGNQYYPLFVRSNSEFLPNASYKEAHNYFYGSEETEEYFSDN